MRHKLVGTLALSWTVAGPFLVSFVTQIGVRAQSLPQPTVTVMSFDGAGSREDADAMADELALRLVETGRFRVLQREWLAVPDRGATPSLTVLRQAAVTAGVEYVVLGSLTGSTHSSPFRRVVTPGVLPSGMARRSGPFSPLPTAARRSFVSVSVEVVGASSGELVRTAVARADPSARGLAPAALVPGLLLRGPVGVIAAVSALHAGPSRLNGGVQRAIADVACTLNLSSPPTSVR